MNQKEEYLKLLEQGLDKKQAAKQLKVDLVQVRSWRMKDPSYNALCKKYTRGKKHTNDTEETKKQFLELLRNNISQREAARTLNLGIHHIRTWKKADSNFKEQCIKLRFEE